VGDIKLVETAAEKAGFSPPEWIVHSASARTTETARLMGQYRMNKPLLLAEQALYLADELTIRQYVAALPAHVNRVAIVGHNPGLTDVVQLFSPQPIINLPTAGMVIVGMKSWDDIRFPVKVIWKGLFIPKTLQQ
jgi:phosphohistidine phosphatase